MPVDRSAKQRKSGRKTKSTKPIMSDDDDSDESYE